MLTDERLAEIESEFEAECDDDYPLRMFHELLAEVKRLKLANELQHDALNKAQQIFFELEKQQ